MSGSGVTIIGASAGSGKTTRLTREVIAAVSGADGERVPVEALFAVTYTKKAQAELPRRAFTRPSCSALPLRTRCACRSHPSAPCTRCVCDCSRSSRWMPGSLPMSM